MSFRTFVDAEGNEWQAFDVVPRVDERRNYDRRISDRPDEEVDERRDGDRRLTVGGAHASVGQEGWLCFERGEERRRLSPIPENWTRATDAELDAYRLAARPVRPSSMNSPRITERNP